MKARWHAPDMYLTYINGIDHVHPFGQGFIDKFVQIAAGNILHEYGHFFNLGHKNCTKL
jgi:hypothetical protein